MPISGSFLQANRRPDPQQAVLHEPDPQHDERGAVDENVTWDGQPYQEVAPAPNVVGLEWVTSAVGTLLDQTPTGHDTGGPFTSDAGPAQLSAAHAVDQGADELHVRRPAPFQFQSDRYDTFDVEGMGSPNAISDVALRRGLDSDPVNNPPLESYGGAGWRHGLYRFFGVEHDYSPPQRVHTYRVVTPNVATVVADAPPPDDPGPYNPPFGSLARAITQLSRRPMIRRVPEPIDVSEVDDGLDQAPVPAVHDWVL